MLVIYAFSSAKERKLISMRACEFLALKVLGNVEHLAEQRAKGSATMKERAARRALNILPTIEHIRSQGHTTFTATAAELSRREIRTAWAKGDTSPARHGTPARYLIALSGPLIALKGIVKTRSGRPFLPCVRSQR